MAKYVVLMSWTDQGIKAIKDSPKRLDAGKALAKKLGGELKKFYMTMGAYDMVGIVEMPDDAAAAKFATSLGSLGNVRTTTLRAFSEDDYRGIIKTL